MGILIGLVFGLGVFLMVTTGAQPKPKSSATPTWSQRTRVRLAQAGLPGVTPNQLIGASAALFFVVAAVVLVISQSWAITLAFAGFAAFVPRAYVIKRGRDRLVERRSVWPEAVDNLSSGIRAGLSLAEAVSALAIRGPEVLRPSFARFGEDYRATGSFSACLDRLEAELADPIADRVIEALRLARDVGGTDLGRLLRTVSTFLREDARTRAELETRQGWTVNAARLALAAPWAVLLLLATQGGTVTAYDSTAGVVVLAAGGAVTFAAYRLMLRIGRLPEEKRVLR